MIKTLKNGLFVVSSTDFGKLGPPITTDFVWLQMWCPSQHQVLSFYGVKWENPKVHM
jgi:hypothetical protein